MKKVILILISLLFLIKNTTLSAQSVAALTQQITEGKATDSIKIEAIYEWLTRNVNYDNTRKWQPEGDTVLRQEPYNVVVLKKAVCMGYAKTFREMCRLSGIEAYVVEGWAKSSSGSLEREGHAWNVVKINNNWHLLDATWDAGNTINPKKYFLMDPSVFCQNHLPRDPMWQLLNAPVSINCFTNNRNCNDDPSPISAFNYADTIRIWQNLDSLQQVYNQAIRTLNFNPNDLMALRELADYYTQKATLLINQYKEIRTAITNKKRAVNGKETVLKLLETSTNYLKSAQINYQELIDKNKKGIYTDAHWNNESIKELLNNLATEKAFVERYFKD